MNGTELVVFGKLMGELGDLERKLIEDTHEAVRRVCDLAKEMFEARSAGKIAEAKILMNDILDIEFNHWGDCCIFGDLAEAWGVSEEKDRRAQG